MGLNVGGYSDTGLSQAQVEEIVNVAIASNATIANLTAKVLSNPLNVNAFVYSDIDGNLDTIDYDILNLNIQANPIYSELSYKGFFDIKNIDGNKSLSISPFFAGIWETDFDTLIIRNTNSNHIVTDISGNTGIGYNTTPILGGIAIGTNSASYEKGIAVGNNTEGRRNGIAIGSNIIANPREVNIGSTNINESVERLVFNNGNDQPTRVVIKTNDSTLANNGNLVFQNSVSLSGFNASDIDFEVNTTFNTVYTQIFSLGETVSMEAGISFFGVPKTVKQTISNTDYILLTGGNKAIADALIAYGLLEVV